MKCLHHFLYKPMKAKVCEHHYSSLSSPSVSHWNPNYRLMLYGTSKLDDLLIHEVIDMYFTKETCLKNRADISYWFLIPVKFLCRVKANYYLTINTYKIMSSLCKVFSGIMHDFLTVCLTSTGVLSYTPKRWDFPLLSVTVVAAYPLDTGRFHNRYSNSWFDAGRVHVDCWR